jgi:signal transduction histidine kinase/class 3 adenylate cyclase
MITLLSKEHPITEKGMMEFQPFGVEPDGTKIQDLSGVAMRAMLEYLEEYASRSQGPEAGRRAVEELVQRLNERIPDRAFHVTSKFLRTPWNGYSNEFSAFVGQWCWDISGDPRFHLNYAREKAISPIIQTLGRPFSVPMIYKMSAYFSQRYSKDSFFTEAVSISERSAILRMIFKERALRHFGPYLKACARLWCDGHKGYLTGVPEMFHDLPPAEVRDVHCIAEGDECCEWEVTWSAKERKVWPVVTSLARRVLQPEIAQREKIIDEQLRSLNSWDQELQGAYVQQQQLSAELQRRVEQLTTLHETGLLFTSILEREKLIEIVLETIIHKLNYDRVMLGFFDSERKVIYDVRLMGVPEEVRSFARSFEIPVTDSETIEGMVLLRGEPVLIGDIRQAGDRVHPLHRQLVEMAKAKSLISVPLKVKDTVLGSLTVDRIQEHHLTQDDLDLIGTVANQVAIALDNTNAYRRIEELIAGLEAKVRERTKDLEIANERLRELDRAKSAFFANINHELRTPLTSTLGALSHLAKTNLSQDHQDLVNVALRNNSQLLYLINELLDLARFDAGQGSLNKRCFDLTVLIRDIKSNFEPSTWRRVTVRGVTTPVLVEADPVQLKKVMFNLLSNAFKFSDPELCQVWIRVKELGDWIELDVEDNGIGIPREHLEHVFDRFFRVEHKDTRRYEGSGIGLALVKEIVMLHGGTVSVESEAGQGSTFRIRLPRGNVNPEELGSVEDAQRFLPTMTIAGAADEKSPAGVDTPNAGAGPIVLVADDNADLRAYLKRLLSESYSVILANDGVMALEQARTSRPELILTDVMMPRMSGYDLLREIRKDAQLQRTPIIFLTARAVAEARIESLEAGADDYIAKPFDEQEVLARVANLIRARAQERQLHDLRMEKLSKFMPAPVAKLLLSRGGEEVLQPHRREITVLFVDLRDFTRFAELAEPEELMAVLRDYQAKIGSLVSMFQGTLEAYTGDAVMIFFNDPVPIPNHVEQAVRMAVAIRAQVGDLCREWSRHGIDLGVGIGIATGYATLGLVGFQDRQDYAAIGTVTNLAARLCAEAKHRQILVPERIAHLLEGIVEVELLGPIQLKGIQRAIAVYNISGLKEQSSAPTPIGKPNSRT